MIAMMTMITIVEDRPGEATAMVTGATEVVAVIIIKIGINHKTTTETTAIMTGINSIKILKTMLKAT